MFCSEPCTVIREIFCRITVNNGYVSRSHRSHCTKTGNILVRDLTVRNRTVKHNNPRPNVKNGKITFPARQRTKTSQIEYMYYSILYTETKLEHYTKKNK
jgi:hypothetical protein